MKSILVGKVAEKKKTEYPYLGVSAKGNVVIFVSQNTGTLVHNVSGAYKIGTYDNDWIERDFEPLKGKITLHN